MEEKWLDEAIASAKANRPEGFERLLEAYGRRLYGYFIRATGSHHDAEDLLGELTLRLVRIIDQYDHHGRFEPWLFRIACNLVRDRIRRRQIGPGYVSLSARAPDGTAMADEIAGDGPAVELSLENAELSSQLQAALAKLDDTTRSMVLLRHYADISFKEIAELFDCPLGTALAKVHRGLKALRRIMGDDDDRQRKTS